MPQRSPSHNNGSLLLVVRGYRTKKPVGAPIGKASVDRVVWLSRERRAPLANKVSLSRGRHFDREAARVFS